MLSSTSELRWNWLAHVVDESRSSLYNWHFMCSRQLSSSLVSFFFPRTNLAPWHLQKYPYYAVLISLLNCPTVRVTLKSGRWGFHVWYLPRIENSCHSHWHPKYRWHHSFLWNTTSHSTHVNHNCRLTLTFCSQAWVVITYPLVLKRADLQD